MPEFIDPVFAKTDSINSDTSIDSASLCRVRAGTSNRVVAPVRQAGNRFLGSLKGLQIRTLVFQLLKHLGPPPPTYRLFLAVSTNQCPPMLTPHKNKNRRNFCTCIIHKPTPCLYITVKRYFHSLFVEFSFLTTAIL